MNCVDYPCDPTPGDSGGDTANGGSPCTEINECASLPCQMEWTEGLVAGTITNSDTCNDLLDFYTCSCQPGYAGFNCNVDLNECGSYPCQNGATCADDSNSYQCTCQPGTSGYNCDVDINECDGGPCQNGGACTESGSPGAQVGLNAYSCACQPGYAGDVCDIDIAG